MQPGEGTEDTKRRVSYRELLPDDPARAEAVRKVIQAPGRPRRPPDHDRRGADATDGAVEVAHEALIRGWTQLRQWIDADRAGIRTHRQLTEAAQEWAMIAGSSAITSIAVRALETVREWADGHDDDLNERERSFLAASELEEQQRKDKEVEDAHRSRRPNDAPRGGRTTGTSAGGGRSSLATTALGACLRPRPQRSWRPDMRSISRMKRRNSD